MQSECDDGTCYGVVSGNGDDFVDGLAMQHVEPLNVLGMLGAAVDCGIRVGAFDGSTEVAIGANDGHEVCGDDSMAWFIGCIT